MKYTDAANDQLESALSGVQNKAPINRQPEEFIVGKAVDTIVVNPDEALKDLQVEEEISENKEENLEGRETDLERTETLSEKAEDS